jgi:predicted nucleic acid-binding protein
VRTGVHDLAQEHDHYVYGTPKRSGRTKKGTSGLYALLNADDEHHDPAVAVMERLASARAIAVTSDWVLAELLGFSARRQMRRAAIELVDDLVRNTGVRVVPATRRGWVEASGL